MDDLQELQNFKIADNVDRDWLLQHLVASVNDAKFDQNITLWTSTGVVSGVLIPARKYCDLYLEEFLKRFTPEAAAETKIFMKGELLSRYYIEDDGDLGNIAFIHLLNARLCTPNGFVPTNEGVLWRGRLSQVTGFSLGTLLKRTE